MKKTFLITAFLFSTLIFSQTIYKYPKGKDFYHGGLVKFYEDLHEILVDKKLNSCNYKKELAAIGIVINTNATAKLIESEDTDNKCSRQIVGEAIQYMKGWIPLEDENGRYTSAVKEFFYLDDLFDHYEVGYLPEKYFSEATFEGGNSEFRKKTEEKVLINNYKFNQDFKILVTFTIDKEGIIKNIQLNPKTDNNEFDAMIESSILSIKEKWTPAKYRDIPIESKMKLPLSFHFD